MTPDEQIEAARRHGHPLPNDKVNGSIVVASVIYREVEDGGGDEFTVILLNGRPPFYTVATITKDDPAQSTWRVIDSVDHMNIVPAVNGDKFPVKFGYVDMGGDY